jgi:hypothetical protein
MVWVLAILIVGMTAGVVLLWFAPLIGAIVIIGVTLGVGVGVGPALFEGIARMLSGVPPWRRRY